MTSKVYQAIAYVMKEMATEGIAKSKNNAMQGYRFRGIDDMYNALARPLCNAGLVILPRVISRHCDERVTAKGTPIFYVTVECDFDFVAVEDGSKHTVKTFGEAMDNSDKATNKAMSAAFKYACMQAFCIPTEGDNDADGNTHEVEPKRLTISLEQQINIEALAKDVGVSIAAICERLKIANLSELPSSSYDAVIKKLESSRK